MIFRIPSGQPSWVPVPNSKELLRPFCPNQRTPMNAGPRDDAGAPQRPLWRPTRPAATR